MIQQFASAESIHSCQQCICLMYAMFCPIVQYVGNTERMVILHLNKHIYSNMNTILSLSLNIWSNITTI